MEKCSGSRVLCRRIIMFKIPDFDELFYGKKDLKEIDKICSTNEYAFIKKKLNTKNLVSLRNPRFCGVSETKRKNVHIVFFLEYRIKLRESMEQISYEYAICGFMEHGQRVYEAYVEHVLTINGEREITGRQEVVRGPNVPVLTSHVGLNPRPTRSCTTLSLAASFVSGKSRTALSLTASLDICCANWQRLRQSRGVINYNKPSKRHYNIFAVILFFCWLLRAVDGQSHTKTKL